MGLTPIRLYIPASWRFPLRHARLGGQRQAAQNPQAPVGREL